MSNGNSSGAVAAQPAGRSSLQVFLDKAKPKVAAALAEKMDTDAYMIGVETAIRRTPKLLECSELSLFIALATCAEAGLVPLYDLAYLIPRYNRDASQMEASLLIGYRGLIELTLRSGKVARVEARLVHEGDEFSYREGLDPDIHHVPQLTAHDRPITHAYAIAWPEGGGPPWHEVMSRSQIEHVRTTSANAESPAWNKHYGQMARKTVIRRLMNYLPLRPQERAVIEKDDELAVPEQASYEPVKGETRTEKVEALIAGDEPEPPKDGPLEDPAEPDLATLEQMAGVDAEKRAEILSEIEGDPESDPRAYKAYRDRLSGIVDQNMEKEA